MLVYVCDIAAQSAVFITIRIQFHEHNTIEEEGFYKLHNTCKGNKPNSASSIGHLVS